MRLFLASGNRHKAEELQGLAAAAQLPLEIVSAAEAGGMPDVEENAGTFVGNARLKAQALLAKLPADSWVLADDSGVCVDALGGGPGVESAYFAGPQHDAAANLQKLVDVMRPVADDQRGAQFRCVLLVLGPGEKEFVFEGECRGRLLRAPRGGAGFGYDPLFVPDGHEQSYAELGDAVKSQISHRARAWTKLADWARTESSRT
ncbi:MAG: RdgB/HAM1 family non-canonical purine NTP pyrophosphatase [Opitutus sp.]|nr:RdgB/HAM1 family non-canonical purine NTP pyrophosphatase [Opitutus sp.]